MPQRLTAPTSGSLILSILTGCALTVDAYVGGSHAARFALTLVALNAIHAFGCPWFCIRRELVMYLLFVGYMLLTLCWTDDVALGLGTVLLATNFALIVILISALFAYHQMTAVLAGLLLGFLCGAVGYFVTVRFPLVYPEDFSYNTMAGMYLFGLFVAVAWGWYTRSRILSTCLSLILLLHIAATTSIKTNLGIILGALTVALLYFRDVMKLLRGNLFVLVAFGLAVGFAVTSSKGLSERVEGGLTRVSAGAEILAAREDASGHIGFGSRQYWKDEGLKGWARNPILGYGVEAFRADYGITSHSTVIDLLYNAGIIGFGLFYGMFVSMIWRVIQARSESAREFRSLASAAIVCYGFMSLSATLYYDTFVAAFIGITVGLLSRFDKQRSPSAPLSTTVAVPSAGFPV